MPLASILLCTIDRYDLTRLCVGPNLRRAECANLELLCVDNGSVDRRVIDYIHSLHPAFHQLNKTNMGYAPMLNQMLLRAKGEYLCVIDNDIELPQGWLRKLIAVNKAIPDSGISGFWCVLGKVAPTVINGCEIHEQHVAGIKFFNRRFLQAVGYYWEEFTPYGCEDAEMLHRSNLAGFRNYYLGGGDCAQHHGHDVEEKTPYRQMKWDALKKSSAVLHKRLEYFNAGGTYYVPAPQDMFASATR